MLILHNCIQARNDHYVVVVLAITVFYTHPLDLSQLHPLIIIRAQVFFLREH